METKQELLTRLQQIIGDHLGLEHSTVTETCTWKDLGADSLDRLAMSLAVEEAFKVSIPHEVGERLNTVRDTVDHLRALVSMPRVANDVLIEPVTTNQQWAEMLGVRTQVFTIEGGFSFKPLPGPREKGIWHFLARDNHDAVGTLSIVDTTRDSKLHQRYKLCFRENDRVARYAQLAILGPYRKSGIFEMLMETAQRTVIHPNEFTAGWLLYPAAQVRSSRLTRCLGFAAQSPLLSTEFGVCHAMVRREPNLAHVNLAEAAFHMIDTCPI